MRDAEDYRNMSLSGEGFEVGKVGNISHTPAYWRGKDGGYPREVKKLTDWVSAENPTYGRWINGQRGVERDSTDRNQSGRWFVSLSGTCLRRMWISPFDLYLSTMRMCGKNRGFEGGRLNRAGGEVDSTGRGGRYCRSEKQRSQVRYVMGGRSLLERDMVANG